jgi:putative ABC transport system substrate-binding protein
VPKNREAVIGILTALLKPTGSFDTTLPGLLPAFYQGLGEAGFVEGKNIHIEVREADGDYDRLRSFAADLVSRNVSVIWENDIPSAFAAKAATKAIPVVFVSGIDPVKVGLVEVLSRPSGNLTGMSVFYGTLVSKQVELLHELLPAVPTTALLGNTNLQPQVAEAQAATAALKQRLEVLPATTESELEADFATMVQNRVGALVVMPDPFFISRREQLVELATRYSMPAIYPSKFFPDLGGLMSYGSSGRDLVERWGSMSEKSSRARSPLTSPSNSAPNLSWRSISRPRNPWDHRALLAPCRRGDRVREHLGPFRVRNGLTRTGRSDRGALPK